MLWNFSFFPPLPFFISYVVAAKIGEGILLDHGTGLVIGETAVVGNWVSLMQVTVEISSLFPLKSSAILQYNFLFHNLVCSFHD